MTFSLFCASPPKGAAPPAAPADVLAGAEAVGTVPSSGCPAMSGIVGLMKDMSVAMVGSGLLYNGELGVCRSTANWFTASEEMYIKARVVM